MGLAPDQKWMAIMKSAADRCSLGRHLGTHLPIDPTAQTRIRERPAAADSHPGRPPWLEYLVAQNAGGRIFLTDSLAAEVFMHLGMNLDPLCAPEMPQILILNGPYGIGKTVGLDETLTRSGCDKIRIQASELESPLAGVPAARIRAAYVKASLLQTETNMPHALILEDIHMAFGVDANTTYTVNTRLAIAALMGICDDPLCVDKERTERVAIFATANDLSNVCGGLLRPGRSRVFAVDISAEERRRIVTHIFQGILDADQTARLVEDHAAWPIAAFRQLKAALLRRSFDQRHWGKTPRELLETVMTPSGKAPAAGAVGFAVSQEHLDQAILAIEKEADAKRDFTGDPPQEVVGDPIIRKEDRCVNNTGTYPNRSTPRTCLPGNAQYR